MQHRIDAVVMMDMFINLLPEDSELQHKSFYTKIKRAVAKYLKGYKPAYVHHRSIAIRKSFLKIEAEDNPTISVAPLLGAVFMKHKTFLELEVGMDYMWISNTNKFVGEQGVTRASAKVVRLVEEGLDERAGLPT